MAVLSEALLLSDRIYRIFRIIFSLSGRKGERMILEFRQD
jgi:hypothetical protein